MQVEFEYYEYIAAQLCGIEVTDLWRKTRKEEVVLARRFCMVYRKLNLKMSQSVSASRYLMNHSNVDSAIKQFNNYKQSKDPFWDLYEKFNASCAISSKKKEPKEIKADHNAIIEIVDLLGWKAYVAQSRDVINQLFELFDCDADEQIIKSALDDCIKRLTDIRYLYD